MIYQVRTETKIEQIWRRKNRELGRLNSCFKVHGCFENTPGTQISNILPLVLPGRPQKVFNFHILIIKDLEEIQTTSSGVFLLIILMKVQTDLSGVHTHFEKGARFQFVKQNESSWSHTIHMSFEMPRTWALTVELHHSKAKVRLPFWQFRLYRCSIFWKDLLLCFSSIIL